MAEFHQPRFLTPTGLDIVFYRDQFCLEILGRDVVGLSKKWFAWSKNIRGDAKRWDFVQLSEPCTKFQEMKYIIRREGGGGGEKLYQQKETETRKRVISSGVAWLLWRNECNNWEVENGNLIGCGSGKT